MNSGAEQPRRSDDEADERERLADEQERLADERERLADHDERAADRLAGDAEDSQESAHDLLLRAEARVARALAEQARAQAVLDRLAVSSERATAADERERAAAAATGLEGEDEGWARDRRDFVAADRDALANVREEAADIRDALAAQRESEADARDGAARRREEDLAQRSADATGTAMRRDEPTERARRDLAAVREAAQRQRRTAAETRRRDAADRANDGRTAQRDPYGGFLVAQFTALTRELFVSQDLFAVAQRVADLSLGCFPGAVASGVVFFEGVRPTSHVTTDDIALQLDSYQVARHDGPIDESLERGEPVAVGDLSTETRWTAFRAMAARLGVSGVAACGLTVRREHDWQALGALTVYAEAPGAFDQDISDTMSLFAAHLAVLAALDRDLHNVSRREAALHRALGSRDVIGQAKGILMERRHIPAGEAFDILRRASQRLNVRLQDLAARLAETGELP